MSALPSLRRLRRSRGPRARWAHPLAGAVLTAAPAAIAVGWQVAANFVDTAGATVSEGLSAAAILAYLAMGTVAGFSVSGST